MHITLLCYTRRGSHVSRKLIVAEEGQSRLKEQRSEGKHSVLHGLESS